jgi:hypothetical protein
VWDDSSGGSGCSGVPGEVANSELYAFLKSRFDPYHLVEVGGYLKVNQPRQRVKYDGEVVGFL